MGQSGLVQVSARSQLATSNQGRHLDRAKLSLFFEILLNSFLKFEEWARTFGRMGVQHPHFLKLALHLEVLNVPFLMEIGG